MAYTESLTSMPNRTRFIRLLQETIALTEHDSGFAVLSLDLDNFHRINDSLGRSAGDHLLSRFVSRLRPALGHRFPLARIGADEFAVIVPNASMREEVDKVAKSIQARLEDSIELSDGRSVMVKCSIGVAMCPRDGADVETLLKKADTALHRAKELGKNNIQYYEPWMEESVRKQTILEQALLTSLNTAGLSLEYQPQFDVATGKIRGLEALLRWNHPTLGRIPPSDFIPVAEESGLIVRMGEWVMDEACRTLKTIRTRLHSTALMAINVSALELRHPSFVERTFRTLNNYGLCPDSLELEITESLLIASYEQTVETLLELHRRGVKIALDDFGTGYSSLSYLQRLPIDTLKIDKSFIRDMMKLPTVGILTEGIIHLVHKLGLEVTAEGIESEDQLARLREWKCDIVQGFLLSHPLQEQQLDKFFLQTV